MEIAFLVLLAVAGVVFFTGFIRAARFAQRNKDKLPGIVNRSTWWIRLLMRNGYGPELEDERSKLALHLFAGFAMFFAIAGAAQFLFAPAAGN